MNKHIKNFLTRGLIFGGFGPIILSIIFYINSLVVSGITFGGKEIFLSTISVYLLAFVHAGASVFPQIEEWGITKSLGIHFLSLYVVYSLCYFVNSWIPFNLNMFLLFTAIFAAVYIVICSIVITCIHISSKKINAKLNK